ncbi:hypothetical protein ABE425_04755 [Chryseobacterium cucumeris]|uniref:hypothetical protein n=1 Tax=Chryseobacterium cucumeris TaxID=1813611 RepID=UPI00320968F6
MIAPQELRLGNKVLRNGIIVTVDNQTFWDVEKYPDQYEPIELNEDWLLKFGFHKVQYSFWINGLAVHNNTPFEFYILYEQNRTYIKYVHQLQNLYFALTGEELKIKES